MQTPDTILPSAHDAENKHATRGYLRCLSVGTFCKKNVVYRTVCRLK